MATGTSLRHIPIALSGNKSFYLKRHSLGEGAFGAVFLYQQHPTLKDVAVKFLNHKYGQKEANILEKIKGLNPDKNNLLKLVEHFTEGWHYCIVFEKLDQDLGHFMSVKTQQRMKVSEIRPVAQQILTALQALKSMGLVHTDIKPNNLMLVNHANHPFKVKLIDFGLARHKFDLSPNSKIQALGYRAPESVFDLPKDESVDMWGLGCSLAYMYLFRNLYPRTSEYEYIATIVQMQGIPPSYVLREGLRVQEFFLRSGSNFQFKTPSMYLGEKVKMTDCDFMKIGTLHDLLNNCYEQSQCFRRIRQTAKPNPCASTKNGTLEEPDSCWDSLELKDIMEFHFLLKQMLCVDSKKRITPKEALNHNFITMNHLPKHKTYPYVTSAQKLMSVCQGSTSTKTNNTVEETTRKKMSTFTAAKSAVQTSTGKQHSYKTPMYLNFCKPVDVQIYKSPKTCAAESRIKNGKTPNGGSTDVKKKNIAMVTCSNTKEPKIVKVIPPNIPHKVEAETGVKASSKIVDSRKPSGGTNKTVLLRKVNGQKDKDPSTTMKRSKLQEQLPVKNSLKKTKTQETVTNAKPDCSVDHEKSKRPHKVKAETDVKASKRIESSKTVNVVAKTTSCKKNKVQPCAAVEESEAQVQLQMKKSTKKLKTLQGVSKVKPDCPVDHENSKRPHKLATKVNIKTAGEAAVNKLVSKKTNIGGLPKRNSVDEEKCPAVKVNTNRAYQLRMAALLQKKKNC